MRGMSMPSGPGRRPWFAAGGVAAILVLLGVSLAGCGVAGATSTTAPGTVEPTAMTPSPVAVTPTPVPTDAGSSPPPSPPSQTATDWGPIWDALPPSYPAYPGAEPTVTGTGPATAVLDAGAADPAAVVTYYEGALEAAGTRTTSKDGPREDGSFELDSTGTGGCLIQTTVTPMGGSTIVTILYGAECPWS